MTPAEEEAAIKKYKKERKSFTDKTRVALMMSMASKDVAVSPQKSQVGFFIGGSERDD